MPSMIRGPLMVAALVLATSAARAQPLIATYTGFVLGTGDPFTAVFRYNTDDLRPSPFAEGFSDALDGTIQSVTYADPFRSLTTSTPGSFSEGRYDSTVFDDAGTVVGVEPVYSYALSSSTGMVFLTFGGANGSGLVTFDADGLDYATLEPSSFTLSQEAVTTVPLPPTGALLAGALALLSLIDRRCRSMPGGRRGMMRS